MLDRSSGRRLLACVAMLLCVAVTACGQKPVSLPSLGPDDIVLAFGDSLTYGTGAVEGDSYPHVLSRLIGREVVSSGVPGEVTTQGLERLPTELDAVRPKILLLCLGGNDMLRKVDVATTESNLRKMIQIARDKGVAVLLIGVPRPALIGGTADFYSRIAEEMNVAFEGDALNDILRDDAYKSDPIHPNAQGYLLLATAVKETLRRTGAI